MLIKQYRYQIIFFSSILSIICVYFAPNVVFDFDPINLKDPKTESVSTLLDLSKTGKINPYSIAVLVENLESSDLTAKQIAKLPLVKSISSFSDLIPLEQIEKLEIIDNLAFIIGSGLSQPFSSERSDKTERYSSIINLQTQIGNFNKKNPDSNLSTTLERLDYALSKISTNIKSNQILDELEKKLFASLPGQLLKLKNSLNAQEIRPQNIPRALFSRYVSSNGLAKVSINPKHDLRDKNNLKAFVSAVQKIEPKATGTPVIILEAGRTVINSFIQAVTITLILIVLLVVILTNSLREIILILTPLFLASLFTVAASVLLNLPFNFANVIVLPLLFGLGIAGSIHLVLADRASESNVMKTLTPRAITFSALTTIGSFGSIALSSHPGTSSMGVLLTIALIFSLFCTLVILPALLTLWPKSNVR